MTPLFPAQRAAEEFDQVLAGTATRAVSERYTELLDTVVVLRTRPEVVPRAEFVGDLRSRLMTAAETELVSAPPVVRHLTPVRTPRTNRRIGTIAASLVIVGGTAGMAAAASGSLPGEALYPIKLGVEQVSTAAHLSDAGKGEALLNQAATRLDEVSALQAQGSPDDKLIAATLDSFRSTANSGSAKLFAAYQADGDAKDINTVRTFTAEQMHHIAALNGSSPRTDALLVDAADTVADIDQQARVLCGPCKSEPALTLPEALAAGAGAAAVDSLLARPVSQAQADIDAAEAARVARLQSQAETEAGHIPTTTDNGTTGGTGLGSASGKTSAPRDQVTSTITPEGKLVPSLTSGAAVKGLVSGVTSGVDDATNHVTNVTQGKTPIDPLVKGLKDTVDDATNGLLPGE